MAEASFRTVQEMLSSNLGRRGEGSIWNAGGYRYEEAASDASDHHLTTAGGVKLYVLAGTDGAVDAVAFGCAADGTTDDTAALLLFAAHSCLKKRLSPGVYLWDGSSLVLGGGVTVEAYGATIKLAAGTYAADIKAICNRSPGVVNYDGGVSRHSCLKVVGLTIDGNASNVSMAGNSMAGFYFHSADNIVLIGTACVDLPGGSGAHPGVAFRFCSDARVMHHTSLNTDRQGVMFWESTGSVRDSRISASRYREPILISSENSVAYQGSCVAVENCDLSEESGNDGARVVRFSGTSSGVVRSCRITGDDSTVGIYVTADYPHEITIDDNKIVGCEYGLLVEGTSTKTVRSVGNRYISCVNGIRWNASGSDSVFVTADDAVNVSDQPVYVASCENVSVRNLRVSGGSSNIFIGTYVSLLFHGCRVEGMTSASYAVNLSTRTGSMIGRVIGNVLSGNTANAITTSANILAEGNDCAFLGAGLRLGRIGRLFLWEDTNAPGKLYCKTSEPASLTDGAVVGAQS